MQLEQLKQIIKEYGVVGAGGAGFPSYAKLDKRADTIILNCAECEPLLKLHRQVLEKNAAKILEALDMMANAIEAKRVIIAIKESYKKAVSAVKYELEKFDSKFEIGILPEIYPAGDEVITIYETTKRVVPPGKIPIEVGVVVFNVETVLNIHDAIKEQSAVIYKYVTVAGEVKRPVTIKVPIGTTIKELIRKAGGSTVNEPVLINGGPMTGVIVDENAPVTKTTNAILVMPENHNIVMKRRIRTSTSVKRAMSSCCQCRMCTELCPRNMLGHPIEPHAFMRSASSGVVSDVTPMLNTMFCSACGLCEMFSCPQGLNPRKMISEYKLGLRKNGIGIPKDPKFDDVNSSRESRRVYMKRLVARLGLSKYNVAAPLEDEVLDIKIVRILLSQHIGAPANASVKKGDSVQKGSVIATVADDKLGACLHASISGVVTEVNDRFVEIQVI